MQNPVTKFVFRVSLIFSTNCVPRYKADELTSGFQLSKGLINGLHVNRLISLIMSVNLIRLGLNEFLKKFLVELYWDSGLFLQSFGCL